MRFLLLFLSIVVLVPCSAAQQPELKRVQVNGTELAYVERGRGEPVLLIHGFMWDHRVWEQPLAALSQHYRVIAYSRRHHWPNPAPEEGYSHSQAQQAKDLAELIRALDLGPAHLIGHSGGANIALLLARDHPELVATLVLGEPGPALMPAAGAPVASPPPFRLKAREAFLAGNDEEGIRAIVAGVTGNDTAQPAEPHMKIFLDNAPVTRAQLLARADPPPSLTCEQARSIATPALLITGETSRPMFHGIARDLAQCLPRVETKSLADAGHGLYLQNPDGFHAAVLAFLKRHPPATGGGEPAGTQPKRQD